MNFFKFLKNIFLQKKSSNWNIRNSRISGKGIFSSKNIKKNMNLGLAFTKIKNTGNPDIDYLRTKLGAFINHSEKPNLKLIKKDNKFYYVTSRNIIKNEELFLDYNEFTWEGKRNF